MANLELGYTIEPWMYDVAELRGKTELKVFAYLYYLSEHLNSVYPSQQRMADRLMVTRQSLSRALTNLQKKNLIAIESGSWGKERHSSHYTILVKPHETQYTVSEPRTALVEPVEQPEVQTARSYNNEWAEGRMNALIDYINNEKKYTQYPRLHDTIITWVKSTRAILTPSDFDYKFKDLLDRLCKSPQGGYNLDYAIQCIERAILGNQQKGYSYNTFVLQTSKTYMESINYKGPENREVHHLDTTHTTTI